MDEGKENKKDFIPLLLRKIFSRDLGIFLIFLFLAFIFWYLNYLRKETETNIKLQLEYINPPDGLVITNNTPFVYLNIFGQGYSLLKFSLNKKNRFLKIDFSSVRPEKRPADTSGSEFYLLTGQVLKEYMKHVSSAEIKVLSFKPDTLFLSFVKNSSAIKTK